MKLRKFENNTKTQLLYSMFLTSLCAWFTANLTDDSTYKFGIIVLTLAIFYITRAIWLPSGFGKNKIRIYSLTIAASVAIAGSSSQFLNKISEELQTRLPEEINWVSEIILLLDRPTMSWPLLIFLFAVIAVVNLGMRETSAMGGETSSFDNDIPEPDFNERLNDAVSSLRDDLYSIDKQTNWSGAFFTQLDAEVYKSTPSGKKRKISNLIKALKNNNGRAHLVLGDPGAGKSVALRKLAADLLEEVKSAHKIPIYVNLKEWSETNWTSDNPPTTEQLYDFVKDNIARRDLPLSIFVEKYFDRLYETKRLFFIFDSFDEIPQVMNVNDDALLIDQLSSALFKFIKSGPKYTGGIVASRKFRKPTSSFEASSEIELRSFSEEKIIQSIKRQSGSNESIIKNIFEHPNLFTAAKNPFMATMIATYIKLNKDLPKSQLDMFTVFIDEALKNSRRKLDEYTLNKQEVVSAAKKIAINMFANYGLEAPIKKLREDIQDFEIDPIIDCLKFARLIRASSVDQGKISFVHRRFCEYFVITDLIETQKQIPFEDIPTDSQWRDALALYCEVAPFDRATMIANRCWDIIKQSETKNSLSLQAIHCMRFLRDAFKGRKECINSFEQELNQFIKNQIKIDKNAYTTILALELSGLLKQKETEDNVLTAIKLNDPWIYQSAIESCKYLHHISNDLEINIAKYINSMPTRLFLKNYSATYFAFSISDAFSKIRLLIKTKLFFCIIGCTLATLLLMAAPAIATIIAIQLTIIAVVVKTVILDADRSPLNYESKFGKILPSEKHTIENHGNTLDIFRLHKIHPNTNIIDDVEFFSLTFLRAMPIFIIPFFLTYFFAQGKLEEITPSLIPPELNELIDLNELILLDLNWPVYLGGLSLIMLIMSSLKILAIFDRQISKEKVQAGAFVTIFVVIAIFIALTTLLTLEKYAIMAMPIIGTTLVMAYVIKSYKPFKKFLGAKKYLNSIKIDSIKTRADVHEIITRLKACPTQVNQFVDLLEANLNNISGDWPDDSILNLSQKYHASRLAMLDSRWRGID